MKLGAVSLVTLGALLVFACGKVATPSTPDVPMPEPRTVDASDEPQAPPAAPVSPPAEAGVAQGNADAGPSAPAPPETATSPTERTGPVLDDADAVARASRVANVALQKAYADFVKKNQIAPSHTGPWVKAASEVKGNTKTGWDVTFQSAPPAGFSHEAVVHVGPKGELTVKKARADFSSD